MRMEDLVLLEELEESAAEVVLAKIADRARESVEFSPSFLYTIEYLNHAEEKKFFRVVANSWGWQDRHKWFFVHNAAGDSIKVAEFYCDKDRFIQQTARICDI